MITVTDSARARILDIMYDTGRPQAVLRVYVQGGGCSGFQYGFSIEDQVQEDDFEVDLTPFKLVVDSISMQYVQGATIDYKQELMGSSFVVQNPNATGHCGCGSSFVV